LWWNEYLIKTFSLNRKIIHFILLLIAIGFAAHQGLLDCCSLNEAVKKNAMLVSGNDQSDAEPPIDFQTYIAFSISTSTSNKHNHLMAVANWKDQTISLHLPPPKG
jgi:hypothetical protein